MPSSLSIAALRFKKKILLLPLFKNLTFYSNKYKADYSNEAAAF